MKTAIATASSFGRSQWGSHIQTATVGVDDIAHVVGAQLVKSSLVAQGLNNLDAMLELDVSASRPVRVDSLSKALEWAMRTISGASEAISGKATELLPLPSDLTSLPVMQCPTELPAFLKDRNYCHYQGYYHTDVTIPSEYFRADVERPEFIGSQLLDFTYLFHDSVENPAFRTMGTGRRIRTAFTPRPPDKSATWEPTEMAVADSQRLGAVLA